MMYVIVMVAAAMGIWNIARRDETIARELIIP